MVGGLAFTHLTASSSHTCGIDTTGKAWCWGRDAEGQLGDGNDDQANEYTIDAVAGGLTFTHLTARSSHTCGIDTTGKTWCWGADGYGQLGDGDEGQANKYTPVAVAGGLTLTHLSAGSYHTCGIDTTGNAWCWGADSYGQLGDGDDDQGNEYAPIAVAGGHTFATTY